jgi:hypothetical protein
MGADGRIVSQGSPSETLLQDKALAEEIRHEQEALELDDDLDGEAEDDAKKASAKGAKVTIIVTLDIVAFAHEFVACSCRGH